MNIVVLDGYAANPGDLCWDELQALGECTIYDRTAPAEVLERAAGAEILLTNKTVLTAEHMAALPELKYIGVLATGYNIVDTTAAKERGIIVTNIPAYSTDSVAQMVFAHILNITQQVQHHSEEVHRGRWTASKDFCFWDTPLIELREKKLGIVGLGHTGFTTARIAIGFGMKVCAYTSKTNFQLPPEIRKMELDELFRECDIISLHCPLTETTSLIALEIFSINSVICTVASLVCVAIPEISVATTENPLPASPALAASILAFKAKRLVCEVIPEISSTMECISSMYLSNVSSCPATLSPFSTECSTWDTSTSISFPALSNTCNVCCMLSLIRSAALLTSSTFCWIASVCCICVCTALAVSVVPLPTSDIASLVNLEALLRFSTFP